MSTDFVTAARGLREQIESEADLTERSGTLSPALVDTCANAGLSQLMVPQGLGGSSTRLDVFAESACATRVAEEAVLFSYRQAASKGLRHPSMLQRALRDMLTGGGAMSSSMNALAMTSPKIAWHQPENKERTACSWPVFILL